MTDDLVIRPLVADEWDEAMTLAARSFQGEPFMAELFGDEPVQRFARGQRFYRSQPWSEINIDVGALIGDVVVGLSIVSLHGQCFLCEHFDPTVRPTDPLFVTDWEFEVNTREAHADQGRHAWISRVVVDPALQGAGIGRRLIAESTALLSAEGGASVLLECQPHREAFYESVGFHRVRSFPDPAGPDALLMRRDVDG